MVLPRETEEALGKLLEAAAASSEPVALLGMGSNILVADEGFPGYVVRLDGLPASLRRGPTVTPEGGRAGRRLCRRSASRALRSEPISGIPSSIGGPSASRRP